MHHRRVTALGPAGLALVLVLAVPLPVVIYAAGITHAAPAAQARPAARKHVLLFTKSSAFEHAVVRPRDGGPSVVERVIRALGEEHGFAVTHTKDGGVFTREGLAPFDALVFFTSGDLTKEGTDKQPPLPPGGKELLLEVVARGKGFVGIHGASDTFHTSGDRFEDNGPAADPFIRMLGGEFIGHGREIPARVHCADPKFPGMARVAAGFELTEEWYSLKNLAPDLHVLQWLATWTAANTGENRYYRRGPYPITWTRMHGKGRVFYTALGHREDVWDNRLFQDIVAGGIRWASRAAPGSARPDIQAVTPFHRELPPRRDPDEERPAR